MGKKQARWARPDSKAVLANLQVSDEVARGDSVRSFCPCHAGWEVFEQNVSVVLRKLRDPSRIVRAHALHVFDDACVIAIGGRSTLLRGAWRSEDWREAGVGLSVHSAEVRSKER